MFLSLLTILHGTLFIPQNPLIALRKNRRRFLWAVKESCHVSYKPIEITTRIPTITIDWTLSTFTLSSWPFYDLYRVGIDFDLVFQKGCPSNCLGIVDKGPYYICDIWSFRTSKRSSKPSRHMQVKQTIYKVKFGRKKWFRSFNYLKLRTFVIFFFTKEDN